MHDVIKFLKGACPTKDGFYFFSGDVVSTRNEQLAAGAPSPLRSLVGHEDFACPSDELESALARMSTAPELSFTGDRLYLRSGRLRVDIQCRLEPPPAVPGFDGEWSATPDGLPAALAMARCFVDDGPRWTAGIRLMDGRVTALSNQGAIDVTVDDLHVGPPVLITSDCAEFLCAAGPHEVGFTAGAVVGRWDDGRWVRAQLMSAEMPASVEGIFDGAAGPALTEVDDAWREAFADADALAENAVTLTASGFSSARGTARCDVSFATGLPEEHRSTWSTLALEPVFKYASRWNPGGYPAVVRFEGAGFRGVVIGQR
jgi:hypothetical protein